MTLDLGKHKEGMSRGQLSTSKICPKMKRIDGFVFEQGVIHFEELKPIWPENPRGTRGTHTFLRRLSGNLEEPMHFSGNSRVPRRSHIFSRDLSLTRNPEKSIHFVKEPAENAGNPGIFQGEPGEPMNFLGKPRGAQGFNNFFRELLMNPGNSYFFQGPHGEPEGDPCIFI